MASTGKWIGGFIGWMAGGPLGALAGIIIGSLFDSMMGGSEQIGYSDDFSGGSSSYQGYSPRTDEGQRNSFLFAMLVLASYIIKADGKAMHSEMELVRRFLRENFG